MPAITSSIMQPKKVKTLKRTLALEKTALELNMQFHLKDEWGLIELLRDFKLFKIGGSKKITNIIHKKDGMLETAINIFDYHYTVSTGKSAATFKQTVFFMDSKKLGLPHFWMKPETVFDKLGEWLGLSKDIDFEAFPKFSEQYWLKSGDEAYIRATMNEDVLQFFTVEREWSLEGCNYFLIFYKPQTLLLPETIKNFYKKGMKICEMLYTEPLFPS